MITISHAPEFLCLTGNPVGYVLNTDQAPGTIIYMRIAMQYHAESGHLTVYEEAKPADSSGNASFHIQEVLAANLEYGWLKPVANGAYANSYLPPKLCLSFYIVYSDDGTTWTSEASTHRALLAAWKFEDYPDRTTELPSSNRILSNKPFERKIQYGMPEFITRLTDDDVGAQAVSLNIFYTDETSHELTFSSVTGLYYHPVMFAIGDDVHDYRSYNPTKTIRQVSVSINGVPVCRLKLEIPKSPFVRQYYYINRLGGLDSVFTTGRSNETLESISGEISKRFLNYDYSLDQGEYEVVNVKTRNTINVNSGYKISTEYQAFLELFDSQQIWEWRNQKFVRIYPKFSSMPINQDGVFQKYFNLSYHLSDNPMP